LFIALLEFLLMVFFGPRLAYGSNRYGGFLILLIIFVVKKGPKITEFVDLNLVGFILLEVLEIDAVLPSALRERF